MQSPQGVPSFRGVGSPASSPWGAQVACARAPCFSRQVCGSPAARPPSRALTVEGGAPPPTPRTWPPASALPGCTPFSPARLTPARAWRRHSHFALANGKGGESEGGKGRKGSRVAPDVTGVDDERRPPLCRPPRPCLSLRAGSRGAGRLPHWESWGAQGPGLRFPRCPALPPRRSPGWNEAGAPEEGAGGSRRDCSDPGAGGAEDAGAGARRRRGRGRGWGSGWQGAVHGSAHPVGAGAGTCGEESPRVAAKSGGCSLARRGVRSWEGPPHPPSPRPARRNFPPTPPDAPRTAAVSNAEAECTGASR